MVRFPIGGERSISDLALQNFSSPTPVCFPSLTSWHLSPLSRDVGDRTSDSRHVLISRRLQYSPGSSGFSPQRAASFSFSFVGFRSESAGHDSSTNPGALHATAQLGCRRGTFP